MSLSKAQRASVFAMFGGKCAYCGCDLPEKGWHADHVEPVLREWWKKYLPEFRHDFVDGKWVKNPNDRKVGLLRPENQRLDNYFPSCRACNIDKSCSALEDWRRGLERKPEVLRKNYSAWRHAERFGIVAVVQPKVIFYFERGQTPSMNSKPNPKE